MSFDHGELNVPLSKRGDIDREIDRYKASAAKARKQAAREHSARFREAKALLKDAFRTLETVAARRPHEVARHIETIFLGLKARQTLRDVLRLWTSGETAAVHASVVEEADLLLGPERRHPGYVIGDHWLEAAYDRIRAGEDERAVLADYGYAPEGTPGKLAKGNE